MLGNHRSLVVFGLLLLCVLGDDLSTGAPPSELSCENLTRQESVATAPESATSEAHGSNVQEEVGSNRATVSESSSVVIDCGKPVLNTGNEGVTGADMLLADHPATKKLEAVKTFTKMTKQGQTTTRPCTIMLENMIQASGFCVKVTDSMEVCKAGVYTQMFNPDCEPGI